MTDPIYMRALTEALAKTGFTSGVLIVWQPDGLAYAMGTSVDQERAEAAARAAARLLGELDTGEAMDP